MPARTPTLTGVHPAADAWPMLDEVDLRRLADDIGEHGLRHPIVIDGQGRILDGRNRLAACRIAGVEPECRVVDVEDAAAYVLSVNNERRHMTTGQRAAAAAMTLAADGRRVNGRWSRGALSPSPDTARSRGWESAMTEAGLVLDHAPELLPAVAAGESSLDAAYKTATETRETAKRRAELPDDLGALVDAGQLALADALRRATLPPDYADRVAAGSLTIDEAETLSTRDQREHRAAIQRTTDRVLNFLDGIDAAAHLANSPARGEVLDDLDPVTRERFLRIEKEITWPSTLT